MYTIVDIKGKQYKAVEGSTIEVDFLGDDVKKIDDVKVLLYAQDKEVKVGTPYVAGVTVKCSFVENVKADKVLSIRYKRKTNETSVRGHRQKYTRLKVDKITVT